MKSNISSWYSIVFRWPIVALLTCGLLWVGIWPFFGWAKWSNIYFSWPLVSLLALSMYLLASLLVENWQIQQRGQVNNFAKKSWSTQARLECQDEARQLLQYGEHRLTNQSGLLPVAMNPLYASHYQNWIEAAVARQRHHRRQHFVLCLGLIVLGLLATLNLHHSRSAQSTGFLDAIWPLLVSLFLMLMVTGWRLWTNQRWDSLFYHWKRWATRQDELTQEVDDLPYSPAVQIGPGRAAKPRPKTGSTVVPLQTATKLPVAKLASEEVVPLQPSQIEPGTKSVPTGDSNTDPTPEPFHFGNWKPEPLPDENDRRPGSA